MRNRRQQITQEVRSVFLEYNAGRWLSPEQIGYLTEEIASRVDKHLHEPNWRKKEQNEPNL
jgi:ribosomal protein S15P/S13E